METYGQMIARLRDEQGWSQQRLADESGVPKRTIQEIEGDNVANPQRRTKQKLAAALGIEGDPDDARAAWPNDVQVFLDIMGAMLSALPERPRLEVMRNISADYITERLAELGHTRSNGQQS